MSRRTGLVALVAACSSSRRRRCRRRSPSTASCSADREPHNWLSYSGTLFNQRYSPLTQITHGQREEPGAAVGVAGAVAREVRGDVARRRRRALHRAGAQRRRRARRRDRPSVLDATTYTPAPDARTCCGRVNRGARHPRRHAVHGHDRRAPDRARRQERRAALEHQVAEREASATRSRTRRSSSRTR